MKVFSEKFNNALRYVLIIMMIAAPLSSEAQNPKEEESTILSTVENIIWGDPIDMSDLPEAQPGDDRPGYRSQVTKVSQSFYNNMKKKLANGEQLNFSERLMVNYFIATRKWPEAPGINADDKHIQEWVSKAYKKDYDFIAAEIASAMQSAGGHHQNDSYITPDLEKFRQFFYNTPPEKRTITMKMMMNFYRSKGYDMRTDSEKIASKEQDKKMLEERKNKIKDILAKQQNQMEKEIPSDKLKLYNCLCKNSGGSMGGYYSPGEGGPCFAVGVFNSWQTGMPNDKMKVLNCLNQIDYDNYRNSLKIFEEMHQHDKNVEAMRKEFDRKYQMNIDSIYQIVNQQIIDENRKYLKQEITLIEKAIRDKSGLIEAAKTFLKIKDYLSKKEGNKLEVGLSSKLWSASRNHIYKGEMDEAVDASAFSYKVRGGDPDKEILHIKVLQWQKQWERALSETFPEIHEQINSGRIITADESVRKVSGDMLHGNKLPEASNAPEYIALKESLKEKRNEYISISNETMRTLATYDENKDPYAAAQLLEKFLNDWEIDGTKRNMLNERLKKYKYLYDKSIEYEKTADMYAEKNQNYQKAVEFYKASLYNQKDSAVQNKLDNVLKIIASELKKAEQEEADSRVEQKRVEEEKIAAEELKQNNLKKEHELAYAKSFSGKWNSTYGIMELKVEGLSVSGNYTHDNGRIEAILSQGSKTMKGTWAEAPSYEGSSDAGKMHFKLSNDGKKIDGLWNYGDAAPTKNWTATRIFDSSVEQKKVEDEKLPSEIKIPVPSSIETKTNDPIANPSVSVENGVNGLSLKKSIYEPSEKIKLNFTASGEYPDKSWIGMFNVSLAHGNVSQVNNKELAYEYLQGKSSGFFEFTAPQKEGEYDFRMLETSNGQEVATLQFKVRVNKEIASLKVDKTTYEPGEKIKLNLTASAEYPDKSWIGMFNASLTHGNLSQVNNKELAYEYLHGKSNGLFEFTAPQKEGEYDFRILETSNGLEVATLQFKVRVNRVTASLKINKTIYKPGEKIIMNFTASGEYPDKSWIGMFNVSLAHGNLSQVNNKELAYEYLRGKSNGLFEFTAPQKAGEYDFRMLETSNGLEVATLKFKVNE